MKIYKDLTYNQKKIYDNLIKLYINSNIKKKDFVIAIIKLFNYFFIRFKKFKFN